MIVIGSSAVIAILLDEPERAVFLEAMASGRAIMSVLNVYEAEAVIRRRSGESRVSAVRALLAANDVELVAFDDARSVEANAVYSRFGKGVHQARLNLCDCAAYALAKSVNAPLLYKGDDFARTDIASAVTPG